MSYVGCRDITSASLRTDIRGRLIQSSQCGIVHQSQLYHHIVVDSRIHHLEPLSEARYIVPVLSSGVIDEHSVI